MVATFCPTVYMCTHVTNLQVFLMQRKFSQDEQVDANLKVLIANREILFMGIVLPQIIIKLTPKINRPER